MRPLILELIYQITYRLVSCTLALPLGADSGGVGQHGDNRKDTVGNVLRWDKGDRSMYYNITGQLLQ